MAKPRIFISSTFYDLKHVRADLDRFIRELGYEPVLNEHGDIPYGKENRLEDYCYKEISNVDILVSIIGGRYGSESNLEKHSISQMELKTALDLKKQVYIFIEKGIFHETQFFKANKGNEGVKFPLADNIKIHQFIEQVEALPNNNIIQSFDSSFDIIHYLRSQWAGLFQQFLAEQTRVNELNAIKGIERTAKTLDQLVNYLTEEKRDSNNVINEILLSNHPAMEQVKQLLAIPFRVFFTTLEELDELLKSKNFRQVPNKKDKSDFEWELTHSNTVYSFMVSKDIFNSDLRLKVYTKEEWDVNNIRMSQENIIEDDDLPF